MKAKGFILQASYRVTTREAGERAPVVYLYGMLEQGGNFLVRDDRPRPHFYIRADDGDAARRLGAHCEASKDRSFDGAPLLKVETLIPADVPPLRERLNHAGIETFEADVRFATRYLIERGIKAGCEIEGDALPGGAINLIFDNPVLAPAEVTVNPRVLSFDIETDGKAERLLAISLFGAGVDEVLIVDGSERIMPERATRCADELAALEGFCERIRTLDPDVVTGWNIIDFDLTVLEKIAARVGCKFQLGREAGALRIRKPQGYFGSGQASVPGRLILDGIDLLRGAFIRMDEYSLEFVARQVLNEGKSLAGPSDDRIGEIVHNYRHDLPAFALYARTDARLAFQIVEKLDVVRLAFARSLLTGMTPDRVAASIASFDFLYLSELERVGLVAPSVQSGDSSVHDAQQGGHVLEGVVGVHENVWVFDFKSLYPSIIRTFNIDPVSYVAERGPDLIEAPAGFFRREPAILPRLLDELFPRREAAKKRGDSVAAHAIKILMNSFYGVLGTPACRFYNPALPNSITGLGKEMLLWSKQWFEALGYAVLYGDTDSLFVSAGMTDPEAALKRGNELAARLNLELVAHIKERWAVTSRLELEFEKLYTRLFLPRTRHGTRGASKRYAGLIYGTKETEFVGMEVVRRDWTQVANRVQRELYQRLFTDLPVDAYLKDIVRRVRNGELDQELIYQKNLRREVSEYVETTPPHVAAARKSGKPLGRSIRYVMTVAGAEPVDRIEHPLDREHYVSKQIRPVAESVLDMVGLDFDRVIGDLRQFELDLS
jgi:DNA polymerase-2